MCFLARERSSRRPGVSSSLPEHAEARRAYHGAFHGTSRKVVSVTPSNPDERAQVGHVVDQPRAVAATAGGGKDVDLLDVGAPVDDVGDQVADHGLVLDRDPGLAGLDVGLELGRGERRVIGAGGDARLGDGPEALAGERRLTTDAAATSCASSGGRRASRCGERSAIS